MTSQIRVLVVDDERIVRAALASVLAGEPDFEVVGQAGDGLEALEQVEQLTPDVVLMDVSMPRVDGPQATRLITAACPHIKVIALSMYDDDWMAQTMLQAGATAYLEKAASFEALSTAIRDAMEQGTTAAAK